MHGGLLIHKHAGVSSFGIIDALQKQHLARFGGKRRDLPKLGHGGTLDPFATGLLVIFVGKAVKLSRYFLGAAKTYEGIIRFGETTVPGDPTAEISDRSDRIPLTLSEIQDLATRMTRQPYFQTPPMHSAKKLNGQPLYELARQGIEVERKPKLCTIYEFGISEYEPPRARFRVSVSSGTYIRALAQDLGKLLGSVAMLDSLERTTTGIFRLEDAWTVDQISREIAARPSLSWEELPCWVPFDRLLHGYGRAQATHDEAEALRQGRQNVLFSILKRSEDVPSPFPYPVSQESCTAIYEGQKLVAVAREESGVWGLERVFTEA